MNVFDNDPLGMDDLGGGGMEDWDWDAQDPGHNYHFDDPGHNYDSDGSDRNHDSGEDWHDWNLLSFDSNDADAYALLDNSSHQIEDWQFQSLDDDNDFSNLLGDSGDWPAYLLHQHFDPEHPDGLVIGDPGRDMECWHQQSRADDCAVVSQQFVLESLTGKHFSENALCREAMNDWCYHPGGGTPAAHVGDLLEDRGIPVERHFGGTTLELTEKLDRGEKIIVAVNSQEIWMPDKDSILGRTLNDYPGIPGQQAHHCVEVTAIVYPKSDPLHPKVVLNDPGSPNGAGMMVPLQQFEEAWAAGDNYVVATALHGSQDAHQDLTLSGDLQHDAYDLLLGCNDSFNLWPDGQCYLNGWFVGTVRAREFYNKNGYYVGKLGTDGNVYDANGVQVGWVDTCHNVHNMSGTIKASGDTDILSVGYYLFGRLGGV